MLTRKTTLKLIILLVIGFLSVIVIELNSEALAASINIRDESGE